MEPQVLRDLIGAIGAFLLLGGLYKLAKYCWKKLTKRFPWLKPSKEVSRFGIWFKEK